MYIHRRRPELSQNFLHNHHLVADLVSRALFSPTDTVLEIGPGKGIITQALLQNVQHVLAVELDEHLIPVLKKKFFGSRNLTLFQADFLEFYLPATPYKVFSNPPFAIEGKIIRKLLDQATPPEQIHLVLIKQVAQRWAGVPREGLFSLSYKPWFEFEIVHWFCKTDFIPHPKVDSVLLKIQKRSVPLVHQTHKQKYKAFIQQGFGGGRRLKQNIGKMLRRGMIKNLEHDGITFDEKPSDLDFEQWIQIFNEFITQ